MYVIKPIVLVVVKMHSFIHSNKGNRKKRITFKKKEINVMDRKRQNLL